MEVHGVVGSEAKALRDVTSSRAPSPAFKSLSGSDRPPVNITRSPVDVPPAALNESVRNRGGVRLHIDHGTNQIVAEIVDVNDEVVRQLPPEEALRVAQRYREVIGIIFDVSV